MRAGVPLPDSSSSLSVSWTAPASNGAPITGYNVYVNGTKTASSPVSGTSTSLTGLPNGTTYSVAVTAVNAAGEGPLSGTSSATTAPVAPVVTATPSSTDTTATLSWTAVPGAASYSISQASPSLVWNNVTATSFTTPALTPGTTYSYTVTAVNPAGGASSAALPVKASYTSSVLASSPVGYYRFNDASGSTAADSATTGGHLGAGSYTGTYTLGGSSPLSGDSTAKSVLLSNGNVNLPSISASAFNSGVSFDAWVYNPASNTASYPAFVDLSAGGAANANILLGRSGTGNDLYVDAYAPSSTNSGTEYGRFIATSALVPGTWEHVAFTWATDGTVSVYANGSLVASGVMRSGTTPVGPPAVARTSNYIGVNHWGNSPLQSSISEAALYPRVLSSSEVLGHYNAR